MKVLKISRYYLRPWASTQPFSVGEESPIPQPPHVQVEFSTAEFKQLANLVFEKAMAYSQLGQEILQTAKDAGIDYEHVLPDESIVSPFDIEFTNGQS